MPRAWLEVDDRGAFCRLVPEGIRVRVKWPREMLPPHDEFGNATDDHWELGRLVDRAGAMAQMDNGHRIKLPSRGFQAHYDPADKSHQVDGFRVEREPHPLLADLFAATQAPVHDEKLPRKGDTGGSAP